MLTNQHIESLMYISENPSNISVDSRVPREVLRFLKNEGYITKSNIVKGADGKE